MNVDKIIVPILKKWKDEKCIIGVIQFSYENGILTIYHAAPNWFNGDSAKMDEYLSIFQKKLPSFKTIKFVQTSAKHV